jgi:opacity protein-like surface antigen
MAKRSPGAPNTGLPIYRMRSTLLSAACAVSILLALTSSVQAADIDVAPEPAGWGWYLSVFGGWSLPDDIEANRSDSGTEWAAEFELDDGFTAGLALGASINEWLRGEVEISGNWHELGGDSEISTSGGFVTTTTNASGDVDVFFVLGNFWVDVPVGETFSPYIGAGLGIGFIDFVGEGASGLAYQLGSGVFVLTPSLVLDIGYRFKGINDAEDNDGAHTDYSSHNILAGVRGGF